jgi:hypothetical protein
LPGGSGFVACGSAEGCGAGYGLERLDSPQRRRDTEKTKEKVSSKRVGGRVFPGFEITEVAEIAEKKPQLRCGTSPLFGDVHGFCPEALDLLRAVRRKAVVLATA